MSKSNYLASKNRQGLYISKLYGMQTIWQIWELRVRHTMSSCNLLPNTRTKIIIINTFQILLLSFISPLFNSALNSTCHTKFILNPNIKLVLNLQNNYILDISPRAFGIDSNVNLSMKKRIQWSVCIKATLYNCCLYYLFRKFSLAMPDVNRATNTSGNPIRVATQPQSPCLYPK